MSEPHEEETEYFDELLNVCEGKGCMQEAFDLDESTANKIIVKWAEEIITRYSS